MSDYRRDLFSAYDTTHVAYLDSSDQSKLDWFLEYARENYLRYLSEYDRSTSSVLDIGCNKGYLLAALSTFGFEHLGGVDLSPDAVEKARVLIPDADIHRGDAKEFLDNHKGQYDIIIAKAVLEHVPKDAVIPLLKTVKGGLKPGGSAIIDVPNMDWLFASHERYMDFTHEVGFTKESLRQILNIVFSEVQVVPVDNIRSISFLSAAKKRVARFILGKLFLWADAEGAANPIWARSIIGVGKG